MSVVAQPVADLPVVSMPVVTPSDTPVASVVALWDTVDGVLDFSDLASWVLPPMMTRSLECVVPALPDTPIRLPSGQIYTARFFPQSQGAGSDRGWELSVLHIYCNDRFVGMARVEFLPRANFATHCPSMPHYLEQFEGWNLGLRGHPDADFWPGLLAKQRYDVSSMSAHKKLSLYAPVHDHVVLGYGRKMLNDILYYVDRPRLSSDVVIYSDATDIDSGPTVKGPEVADTPDLLAMMPVLMARWMACAGYALVLPVPDTRRFFPAAAADRLAQLGGPMHPEMDRPDPSARNDFSTAPTDGPSLKVLDLRDPHDAAWIDTERRAQFVSQIAAWTKFYTTATRVARRRHSHRPYVRPPKRLEVPGITFLPWVPTF